MAADRNPCGKGLPALSCREWFDGRQDRLTVCLFYRRASRPMSDVKSRCYPVEPFKLDLNALLAIVVKRMTLKRF
jgi:hypothetical protein